jgi:hypothetical protein
LLWCRNRRQANKPYNKHKANGCSEFGGIGGGYTGEYQFGCETHTTQASCELLHMTKKSYCPYHPDIVGCADFLLGNATYKTQGEALTDTVCALENVSCLHESNPERYCLQYDDPAFCSTIGDICDEDGFVRPEDAYRTR